MGREAVYVATDWKDNTTYTYYQNTTGVVGEDPYVGSIQTIRTELPFFTCCGTATLQRAPRPLMVNRLGRICGAWMVGSPGNLTARSTHIQDGPHLLTLQIKRELTDCVASPHVLVLR